MRGQYSSAMEHAVPEQAWVDKSTCKYVDENGQIKNPGLQPCLEGISAVKSIAIAQSQGQKIYTITRENAATALPKLPVGGDVGVEIRSAIQAGKEVIVHQSPINVYGWTGFGYIIIDPDTGGGAYLIEGKGSGGFIDALVPTLQYIGYFYDSINIALKLSKILIPQLNKLVQFIQIAKLVADLLSKGSKCSNFGGIAMYLALTTMLGLLITEFILAVTSPIGAIAALMTGIAFDFVTDWLLAQSSQCQQ